MIMVCFDIENVFICLLFSDYFNLIWNLGLTGCSPCDAPLSNRLELHSVLEPGKYDKGPPCPLPLVLTFVDLDMDTIQGPHALQWAKELSKLPDGCFTIVFYPYSKVRGKASAKLVTKVGCKYRAQLPQERFQVDSENLFLFTDADGKPKSCYRILIRYMGFSQDGFKLHKVDWLWVRWMCGET